MSSKYLSTISINNKQADFFSIKSLEKDLPYCSEFPYSYKVLIENILRNNSSDKEVFEKINLLHDSLKGNDVFGEIDFYPSRVIMQDFTGVPALADLASMRENVKEVQKLTHLLSIL